MLHFFKRSNKQGKTPSNAQTQTLAPTAASAVKTEKRQHQEYWAKIYTLILFLNHKKKPKPIKLARNPLFMREDFVSPKLAEKQKAARRYLALKFFERIR